MAGEETNGHWTSRLDRMEGLLETLIQDHLEFKDEHRSLLRAQVLLTDHVEKLTLNLDRLAEAHIRTTEAQIRTTEAQKHTDENLNHLTKLHAELAEAQKHTDERLNALINIVDDIIRKRPPQAQ